MAHLPVITGVGGINAAGRSSGFHSYRRMIFDCLNETEKLETQTALAALTGKISKEGAQWVDESKNIVDTNTYLKSISQNLLSGTLIRKLENNLFDPQRVHYHSRMNVGPEREAGLKFDLLRKQIPATKPPGWNF